jgi:3,4-dihydroxy-2-butanone 4-phosphate synthase
MVKKTNDKFETPFTVSVDGMNTHSGMSVHDRLKTISIITNDKSKPKELQKPGHLFPLRARKKLLLERKGHTESSIELMKISSLKEIAIIVEIINDDGTMAKGKSLISFAKKHNLQIISIDEIFDYQYSS